MTTKTTDRLTLTDRLSRLNYTRACQLLGPEGNKLINRGGTLHDMIVVPRDVYLRGDLFRVNLPAMPGETTQPIVSITSMASARDRLHFECSVCETACVHVGAAFSLILEEKTALGLARPPKEKVPVESLREDELVRRSLAERAERARTEKFQLKSSDVTRLWTDYRITSAASGKSYRVALRGQERGESYCSCPDFRTNTLGTCKHILHALRKIRTRFSTAQRKKRPRNLETFVHVLYGNEMTLHLRLPDKLTDEAARIARKLAAAPIDDVQKLVRTIAQLEQIGHGVTVYPDAEELIDRRLFQDRIAASMAEIRQDPERHPLRRELLKTELLPYQLDGIAFAVAAGRAILADDMGLGKTIQGIGVAELLAREAQIRRVLVVCPTSLKSQWRHEIGRFSDRNVQLVVGAAAERPTHYRSDCFFTVCNYEQVLRDIVSIEQVPWDLVILDEGQRIKNWESKTARVIKGLKSPFALVLSGTPLENRLDELYSIAQFIDDRRLGPAFRFFNRHRVVDENGKILGYKNLDLLRDNLKPVLLRRTRDAVLDQLPERTTEIVRIPPTAEQRDLNDANVSVASMIANKKYISEMDLLRLQKALLMARMSADSTYLVDKQKPGYSSKLERLAEILEQLFTEPDRKAVLFSEWTTMLGLIEPILKRLKLGYVRLDGSVPQKKRQELVDRFQHEESCRLFIATNAGSTGLNLQAANTVINVDLPWNPAVLEQRIARAHRMGQKRAVQVYVLVTEQTIEENMLGTLAAKHDLFLAALDAESDVSKVDMASGIEELRRRLEVLLGARPEAPVDESNRAESQRQIDAGQSHRERVAAAGGELLGAAFQFLGQLVASDETAAPPEALVTQLHNRLSECVDDDGQGKPRLTITLPDRGALQSLAQTLARLLVSADGNAAQVAQAPAAAIATSDERQDQPVQSRWQ